MNLKTLTSFIIVLYCIISYVQAQTEAQDCETLNARCKLCRRSLNEGPNEDNTMRRLNNNCRLAVGREWVWRDLKSCEIKNIRCLSMNRRLTCAVIAEVARMQRRLP